ncbi:hypothetical protein M441DRAFT_325619 [Trichoderma asperellum CBS 433.97]|uniref:Uncharacterized protein n=1 Tax=Trichoderma asperellum (strain ATCC 204424 / CBS 433.97 / NBRC 101777) TaxID=1042311 RepID=A0A2T3ZLZ1_TRIA4|nr:hypothetical protein M441DRAFT_325619 [Trichoderma asperellum CBS 433.97]PTB45812.1 hypothetical protein M441DRAFT_325619 [Trichoderma asperellum CBS 433.97]
MFEWPGQCAVCYAAHTDKCSLRRVWDGGNRSRRPVANPGFSHLIKTCGVLHNWRRFTAFVKSRKLHTQPAALRMGVVASEEHQHSDDITRLAINCAPYVVLQQQMVRAAPPHRVQGRHQVRLFPLPRPKCLTYTVIGPRKPSTLWSPDISPNIFHTVVSCR